jgi:hypothetical protein
MDKALRRFFQQITANNYRTDFAGKTRSGVITMQN